MFYHGTILEGLTEIKANAKSHATGEKVAYFTTDRCYALICCRNQEENFVTMGIREDGKQHYFERFPDQLETIYSGKQGYIYSPKAEVELTNTKDHTWECETDVPVGKCEYVEDVYKAILEEEKKGNVVIHRYQELPPEEQKAHANAIRDAVLSGTVPKCMEPFFRKHFALLWDEVTSDSAVAIKRLDYDTYQGKSYHAEIRSDRYLSIEPKEGAFSMEWVICEKGLVMPLEDDMMSDWLENPAAYGAFDGEELIGFVEGFLEEWNNRYRITNICVFDEKIRQSGVGTRLLQAIMRDAVLSGARMAVLETQSFNFKAISFYKKHGFEIIGFDRYAYTNNGPEEHNMLIYMGKKLR